MKQFTHFSGQAVAGGRLFRTAILLLTSTTVLAQDPATLFKQHCSPCHREGSEARAPLPDVLSLMPRPEILAALETGSMKTQGDALSHRSEEHTSELQSL